MVRLLFRGNNNIFSTFETRVAPRPKCRHLGQSADMSGPLKCPNPECTFQGYDLTRHYTQSPPCRPRPVVHDVQPPAPSALATVSVAAQRDRLRKTFVLVGTAKLQDRLLDMHVKHFLGPTVLEAAAALAA